MTILVNSSFYFRLWKKNLLRNVNSVVTCTKSESNLKHDKNQMQHMRPKDK